MKITARHFGVIRLGRPVDESNICRVFPLGPQLAASQAARGILLTDRRFRMLGYVTTQADSGELNYRTQTQERICASS